MVQDHRRSDTQVISSDLDATSSLLQVYLRDIARVSLLEAEQEAELSETIRSGLAALEQLRQEQLAPEAHEQVIQRIKAGRVAERQMVEANLRLVVSIAHRYEYCSIPLVDLIQEGNLGLLKAVQRYDSRLHFRFSTYATYWIRQTIGRLVAEHSRIIRVPSHVAETMSHLRRTSNALQQSLGRRPSVDEMTLASPLLASEDALLIQAYLESSQDLSPTLQRRWDKAREQVRMVLAAMSEPISLGMPLSDDGDATLEEVLASPQIDPAQEVLDSLLWDSMCEALGCLSSREQMVLRHRFGLQDSETLTLEKIGENLGVTRERVRQIEKNALLKLRQSGCAQALALFLQP